MELESQVWCLEKEATELRETVEQQKAKNNVSMGLGRLLCRQGASAGPWPHPWPRPSPRASACASRGLAGPESASGWREALL